jgi:hypothetical protein
VTKLQILEPEVDRVKATVYRTSRPTTTSPASRCSATHTRSAGWAGTGGSGGSGPGTSGADGSNTERDDRKALCRQEGQGPPYAQAREEARILRLAAAAFTLAALLPDNLHGFTAGLGLALAWVVLPSLLKQGVVPGQAGRPSRLS